MNILDKIVENKKEEVQFQMKNLPLSNLEELINIFPKMLKGQTSGRIIVDVNK